MRKLVQAVGSFLGLQGKKLQHLDLSGVPLGKMELTHNFCRELPGAGQLQRLILANCHIGDIGVSELTKIARHLHHLRFVSLADNSLTKPSVVMRFLRERWSRSQRRTRRSYEMVDLSGNPRLVREGDKKKGETLLRAICELIREGYGLKFLHL